MRAFDALHPEQDWEREGIVQNVENVLDPSLFAFQGIGVEGEQLRHVSHCADGSGIVLFHAQRWSELGSGDTPCSGVPLGFCFAPNLLFYLRSHPKAKVFATVLNPYICLLRNVIVQEVFDSGQQVFSQRAAQRDTYALLDLEP